MTEVPRVNGTLNATDVDIPEYVGFISVGIATLLFGTNFIPVKQFETGDGVFFHWVFCNAIFICGLVIQIVRRSTFFPFAMIGGLLWATGNLWVVPIVKTLGLGLGICIWASVQLLIGWVNGRFGLVGMEAEVPPHVEMNYGGVALSMLSTVIYAFVRPEIKPILTNEIKIPEDDANIPDNQTTDNQSEVKETPTSSTPDETQLSYVERLSPIKKKVLGVVLASFSGTMYAIQFIPSIHIQETEKDSGASQNSIDYVFAHFCGILLSSTVYFLLYVIYRRNRPNIYPRAILPAFVSGTMYAVATSLWFVANRSLSEPVSFPIISTVPPGISLVVGILVYKEIRGRRNISIVVVALIFTISGAIIASLSKLKNF